MMNTTEKALVVKDLKGAAVGIALGMGITYAGCVVCEASKEMTKKRLAASFIGGSLCGLAATATNAISRKIIQ